MRLSFPFARRTAVIYLVFGVAWIVLSSLLLWAHSDHEWDPTMLGEMAKGLAYVGVTAGLLYLLLHRTERRLARQDQQLRELSMDMEDMFRQSHEYIACWDRDLRLIRFNPLFASLVQEYFGTTVRPGMALAEFAGGDAERCTMFEAEWRRALTGESFTTLHCLTKAERRSWFEASYAPLYRHGGEVIGAFHVISDVNDRVRAEEYWRLYAILSRAERAVAIAPSAKALFDEVCAACVRHGFRMAWVGTVDSSGHIQPAAAAGRGTDYLEGIVISTKPSEPAAQGLSGQAFITGRPVLANDFRTDPRTAPWRERAEIYGWRSAAAVPFFRRGDPAGILTFYSEKQHFFDSAKIMLLEDLSNALSRGLERLALEGRQREAERALIQAEMEKMHTMRLSILGEVASTIAHEVNQPIAAANNFIQAAAVTADPRLGELLDKAGQQIRRAAETVKRVKEFAANRGVVHPQTVDVRRLIDEGCALGLLGEEGRRVEASVSLAEGIRPVTGDPIQLQQVITNLVRNAVEAVQEAERRQVWVSATPAADGMVEIAVRDSGPGIPADLRPRLFTPFATSKPQGTGLGLSTARAIIRAHGGDLWHTDPPEGGACFHFTLPEAEEGGTA